MINAEHLRSSAPWQMQTSEYQVDESKVSGVVAVACLAFAAVMPVMKLGRNHDMAQWTEIEPNIRMHQVCVPIGHQDVSSDGLLRKSEGEYRK